MELKLTDTQFESIISKAILETFPSEERDALLEKAIANLLRSDSGQKNELQRIFNDAVKRVARSIVETKLSQDEAFIKQVNDLFTAASTRVFEGEGRESIIDGIAGNLKLAITGSRY